ncbi:MAG: GGDEF domain-containing protein [Gemmatimonadota bacterium]
MTRHFQVATSQADSTEPGSLPDRLFTSTVGIIEALPATAQYAISFALILLVFVCDVFTGSELAFSIFYLLPIALLAWHRGLPAGIIGVLASGLAWLIADVVTQHVYSNQAIQYWNALVRAGFFLIVAYILTVLRRAVNDQQRLARTDSLTGVANSRWFLEIAAAEVARQRRYARPLSIAFLDCDDFKQVNDRFGHTAGDGLLKRIAACVQDALREVDVVARLGGDEFALLLPETDACAANIVCAKVRDALTTAVAAYDVTFSIGLVTYLVPPVDVEAMIHAADQAMYDAKKTGKNASRHRIVGERLTQDYGS